jgi:hypothetical protein
MPDPYAPKSQPAAAMRAEGAQGYLVSSFELSSGLEVTPLAVASLPAEVLRELQRLRLSWEPAPKPAGPAAP